MTVAHGLYFEVPTGSSTPCSLAWRLRLIISSSVSTCAQTRSETQLVFSCRLSDKHRQVSIRTNLTHDIISLLQNSEPVTVWIQSNQPPHDKLLRCPSSSTCRTRTWSVWRWSASSRRCCPTASTTWTASSGRWPGTWCWIRWRRCTAPERCRTAGWQAPSPASTGGASAGIRPPGWAARSAAARPSTSCSTWSISWSPCAPAGWEGRRSGRGPR